MLNIRKFLEGLRIIPRSSTAVDSKGELEVLDSSGKLRYHDGSTASNIVTADHTETLVNKSIDADNNTITNIDDADIKAAADITRTKLAPGTADHVIINDAGGEISSEAQLAKSRGGTGADNSSVTFPASGTIVTETGTHTLTNKSIDADNNTITNIDNADIKAGAAIDRTKVASGTANHVIINDGSGVLSSEASLDETRGGTAQTTYATGDILYASAANTLSKLAAGSDGNVLTLASGVPSWAASGGGSGGGFGSGGVLAKAANYTVVGGDDGKVIAVDSSGGAYTITLPAAPSAGFNVTVKDASGNSSTNNITIARNGNQIDELDIDLVINSGWDSKTVIFDGTGWYEISNTPTAGLITATGGSITTDGDYKVHTFNSSGTFEITSGRGLLDYLIVAGGGGGGAGNGGGAGAGGFIYKTGIANGVGSYTVTVGAGGAAGAVGSNSSFLSDTAIGGGNGGSGGGGGGSGGSGGGGGSGSGNAGGSGTVGQGFKGGDTLGVNQSPTFPGSGGGGAGAAGGDRISGSTSPGAGGDGLSNSITGSPVTRAGGGGGGTSGTNGGAGGAGGGGSGNTVGSGPGFAGTANSGGGGGGGSGAGGGGAGGSGVVIVRYKFQ